MKISHNVSELISLVHDHQRIFIHGASATPQLLVQGLLEQAERFHDLELCHLHTSGDAAYADSEYHGHFRVANFFVGENMRKKLDYKNVDYLPCFLSEIPQVFRSGRRKPDVAFVQVSPPDAHGYCSLGTSVDIARAAVETASVVIAQINTQMPRTHGDGFIHRDRITAAIECDLALPESFAHPHTDTEKKIAHYIASLVEYGSTLQMGIGSIPDATLTALKHHRHLGVHTEMFSDGLLPLIESGAVDNSQKIVHPGKTVAGFVTGTKKLYDFVNDNQSVVLLESDYVNNTINIARNPKVVAINSAVQIDLTGQVCADSIGSGIISGVGGQMDFIRGASLSPGGKAIIALPSTTRKGQSRLVNHLNTGAGVVTTRSHVHYVITEYGIADLYGKTLNERAKALIAIADPEHQENLEREWRQTHLL